MGSNPIGGTALNCLRFAPARIALRPAAFVVAGQRKSVLARLLLTTAARNPVWVRFNLLDETTQSEPQHYGWGQYASSGNSPVTT